MEQEIIDRYVDLTNRYKQESDKRKRQLRIISWLRLALFISIILVFIYLIPLNALAGWLAVLACLAAFLWMIKLSVVKEKLRSYYQNLSEINLNELKALGRDFSAFSPGNEYVDPNHDYSYDLDLFGENSFFQFLNRTVTSGGKNSLAESIQSTTQGPDSIRHRQEAISELAECLEWRQQFLASGKNAENIASADFLLQEREEIHLKHTAFLKPSLVLLPAITLVLGFLWLMDVLPDQL
ncbi:MAG TPA: hypothetical protein VFG54_06020, partial [Prolixibacteraceae bacterium]|nr:hypothetical protein [Prolixibacteraceae bacterium]